MEKLEEARKENEKREDQIKETEKETGTKEEIKEKEKETEKEKEKEKETETEKERGNDETEKEKEKEKEIEIETETETETGNDEKEKEKEIGIERNEKLYKKPASHRHFWKTFGLDSNAGKMLYQLYEDKKNNFPSSFLLKKEKTENERENEKEKERERKRKEEEEAEKLRRKMHISYPTYKKKQKPKTPEKISQRKPLAKILEETKNYECLQEIPGTIGKNRDHEKNALIDKFVLDTCKMVPTSCAALALTEEEKNDILRKEKNKNLKFNGTNNREEKMKSELKFYIDELQKTIPQKLKELKTLNEKNKNIDEYNYPKEYAKWQLQKCELINEIEESKRSLKKTQQIWDSLK